MKSKLHILAKQAFLSSWVFAGCLTATAQPKVPTDIPVEMFAALPSFANPKLSPSGEFLAFFASTEGQTRLIISGIAGADPLVVSVPEKQTIVDFRWLQNDILLYRASYSFKRRRLKVRTTETRMHRLDMKTRSSLWLGAPDRTNLRETNSQHERVIDTLPLDPDHVLIELDLNLNSLTEVYKVSLDSGHKKIHERERANIHDWLTDADSTVRLATGVRRDKFVSYLKDERGRWRNLEKAEWAKKYSIEGFATDPDFAYVSGPTAYGTRGLFLLKLSTGEITKTLFAHKQFDMDSVARKQPNDEIVGAVYIDDFPRIAYFDPTYMQVQKAVDRALPDTINTILSRAPDKDWYFLSAESSTNPGNYYIFDRPNGNIGFVASNRQDIEPGEMARTESVIIPAKNGGFIPSYLTRATAKPFKTKSDENKPAGVIMPHGGPFGVGTPQSGIILHSFWQVAAMLF